MFLHIHQFVPFSFLLFIYFTTDLGFEPKTNASKTPMLPITPVGYILEQRWELNPLFPGYEPDVIFRFTPLLVGNVGFEPLHVNPTHACYHYNTLPILYMFN